MDQTYKIIMIAAGMPLISIILLGVGFFFGRQYWAISGFLFGWMHVKFQGIQNDPSPQMPMVDGSRNSCGYRYGMMESGVMNRFGARRIIDTAPLSIDDTKSALVEYLSLFDEELIIRGIMVFSNHAYVQVVEEKTGIGAMELLVEPVTYAVIPEFGPNMVWNTKYGMLNRDEILVMMSDGKISGQSNIDPSKEMLISKEEAVVIVQEYLDSVFPGSKPAGHADQFYGYYTIHIEDNGDVVGILSVNGFTGQVFVHTWHGGLIEMIRE